MLKRGHGKVVGATSAVLFWGKGGTAEKKSPQIGNLRARIKARSDDVTAV